MPRLRDWVDEEIDVFFYIRRFSGCAGLLEEGCPFIEAVFNSVFGLNQLDRKVKFLTQHGLFSKFIQIAPQFAIYSTHHQLFLGIIFKVRQGF